MDSEDLAFILYTSGSTGKPKGIIHTTGGYMVGCYVTTKYVFDLHDDDVYWCTADVGWITGHSYVVYGPLSNGATTLMYEGAPNHPDFGRFWDIINRHKVTIFYTAPTAIRRPPHQARLRNPSLLRHRRRHRRPRRQRARPQPGRPPRRPQALAR